MTSPRSPATILPIDKASPEAQSANLVEGNLAQLKALFPEAFTENRVDFDVLKQLLGAAVDEREEKYGLNWHGKRRARQLALTPSTGTLRPCPEESVDWDTTQNLFIEGDNLEVLKLLQKSYAGKVKLIYIDPPYNTGRDFVYPDNFQDSIKNYLELTGQVEGGQRLSSNTDASGRFHTDWLNMIYPRLKLARGLLKEDGVICISIDDGEEANLRKVCDEVFGEENHVATIVWQKRYVSNVTAQWLSDMHDFIVVYAKAKESLSVNSWDRTEDQLAAYKNPDGDPRGKWRAQDLSASKPYAAGMFSIVGPTGLTFDPPPNRYWRCSRQQFDAWVADGRIWWGVNKDARPMLKSFLDESERGITPHTWWEHEFAGHNKEATLELKELFAGDAPFDTPKPVKLMKRLIQLFSGGGDLLMDFFCGSAAFGHAAQELASVTGRPHRFVLVQLPEKTDNRTYPTIADIAKERLRRSGKLVRDQAPLAQVDVGFRVFKLDSSNVRAWNPRPDDLSGTLLDHAEHLTADRSEQDVLHELLLKLGLDLSVPMESRQIAGKTVHSIGAGALMACLSDGIDRDVAEPLALGIAEWQKAQAQALQGGDDNAKPVSTKLVFKDSAFADDVAKTNLAAILSQHGLDDVRSI